MKRYIPRCSWLWAIAAAGCLLLALIWVWGEGQDGEKDGEEALPAFFCLDVAYLAQNPELPTGCEAVSLTTVLNYLGYEIDKCDLVDNYLPQGEIGSTNPNQAFIGSPYDAWAYGCYAPVIVMTANAYLQQVGASERAVDLSGTEIDTLLTQYLYKYERPVIFWASQNMEPIRQSTSWVIGGENITWRGNNHCLVLIGWSERGYIFSDPLCGIVEYDKEITALRYAENGMQAVYITSGEGAEF